MHHPAGTEGGIGPRATTGSAWKKKAWPGLPGDNVGRVHFRAARAQPAADVLPEGTGVARFADLSGEMHKEFGLLALALLTLSLDRALARGVSPYLPLNLDPEVERQVERVLILADKPVMTRPIPAGLVLDALPKACKVDAVLCEQVRHFLENYMKETGIGFASLEGSSASGKADPIMPMRHGETTDSHYELAGMAYFQPSDYWMVSAGGVAYQDRITPTGSMLSLGFDWAQLDLGYRDHWWSPMTDRSMLISTEAPTMPSVTLSNWRPLGGLGFQYEVFVARMSETDRIVVPVKQQDGTYVFENTRGYPKFAGLHLQI